MNEYYILVGKSLGKLGPVIMGNDGLLSLLSDSLISFLTIFFFIHFSTKIKVVVCTKVKVLNHSASLKNWSFKLSQQLIKNFVNVYQTSFSSSCFSERNYFSQKVKGATYYKCQWNGKFIFSCLPKNWPWYYKFNTTLLGNSQCIAQKSSLFFFGGHLVKNTLKCAKCHFCQFFHTNWHRK